ncbi:MAG: hypothetical protein IEMM0003_0957 [bacterium]|nr:MAG: hypothetical protein IEMM0003_0957 [bacterium]
MSVAEFILVDRMIDVKIDIEKIKNNYKSIIEGKKTVLKFKASSTIGLGHLSRMITRASFVKNSSDLFCAINDDEYTKQSASKYNQTPLP